MFDVRPRRSIRWRFSGLGHYDRTFFSLYLDFRRTIYLPSSQTGDDFDDEGGAFTFHTRFLKYKKIILNKKN